VSFVFADHSPYMDGQLKPMQSPVLVREKQDSAGSTEQVVVDCVQAWTVTGLSLASMYSFCVQVPFVRQLFVSAVSNPIRKAAWPAARRISGYPFAAIDADWL